jgi:protein-tyrosine-phosphatase
MAPSSDARVYNVLFLCTHNSVRSIMAEVILNHVGKGRFRAFSAGSTPRPAPDPFALQTLANLGLRTEGLQSKSWDVFAKRDAPVMDFVLTVCDNAAGEVCPVWPGQPITAHWGIEDPSLFQGPEDRKLQEFARVARGLERRIELFVGLAVEKLDRTTIEKKLRDIGKQ